jgi:hypothetical protein
MKTSLKVLLTLLAITVLGVVGYFCGYRMGCDPVLHEAARYKDSMAWLRYEFHLTPAQFEAIKDLHAGYAGTCDEHCRNIRAAMSERDRLATSRPEDKAEVAAADRRIQELSTHCETVLGQHLEKVAALMSPADGERYLAMMRPRLAQFDHSGAPDLSFSKEGKPHVHSHE